MYTYAGVFDNVKFRDIDWEVSLVLSSRSVGVLDEPLVSVHLGDNKWVSLSHKKHSKFKGLFRGKTVSMELNQEELSALISEVSRLKSEMERQFLHNEDK